MQLAQQAAKERERALEAKLHRMEVQQEKYAAALQKEGKTVKSRYVALHDDVLFNKWSRYTGIMVSPWVDEDDFKEQHILEAFPTEKMRETLRTHVKTQNFVCALSLVIHS